MSIQDEVKAGVIKKGAKGAAVKLIQQALGAAGAEVVADGQFGDITYEAVRMFQAARSLTPDGEVGPLTAAALDGVLSDRVAPPPAPLLSVKDYAPWYSNMRAISGTKEVPGSGDNPLILSWPKEIAERYPELAPNVRWFNHDSIAWCGLAMAWCMAKAGYEPPLAPLGALNWANDWKYGRKLSKPIPGCVMVFKRTGGGHVSTYESEDASAYSVRGGNQSDMVNVTRVAKSHFVAAMWPKDAPVPSNVKPIVVAAKGRTASSRQLG